MKVIHIITVLFILIATTTYAQFTVDAELRPRAEYRHGFKTLYPNNSDPAMFVSQRTRLNTKYSIEKLNFYVSFQDVRVWGDVPQLNSADNNGLSLHQAWGELLLDSNFSLKLGRQEVVYDDSRIFGNVDWAQQARSHDLALLKYQKDGFRMDFGLAFNQPKEEDLGTDLGNLKTKTYKAMQYVWLHKDWHNFSGSFLILNNGMQTNSGLKYSQTVGTHLKTKKENLSLVANLYYQFGNDLNNNDLNAYLLALEANYKITNKTKIGLGVELQSGNDYNETGDNKAFTPFYGTNHKFNGFMDYFYVGNHGNSVGLLDIYAKANFKLNPKSSLTAFVHNFSAAADINSTVSRQLGTEIDLVYDYKFTKEVGVKAGYSQMFASEGMEVLKGNSDNNTNNWGWVMVTIKPTLFSSKK